MSRRTPGDLEGTVPDTTDSRECKNSSPNVNTIVINADEKFVVDAAERKLEELVGVIAEDNEDVCLMFEEEEDLESKIHDRETC